MVTNDLLSTAIRASSHGVSALTGTEAGGFWLSEQPSEGKSKITQFVKNLFLSR